MRKNLKLSLSNKMTVFTCGLLLVACASLVSADYIRDDDIDLADAEDRAAFNAAEQKLRNDPNSEAIWRALDLVGSSQPGSNGDTYGIEEAIAATAAEIYHRNKPKGFTRSAKFSKIFNNSFVEPCKSVNSLWGDYLSFILHELESASEVDQTVPEIRQAHKFCDFVKSKGAEHSVYIEFKHLV